MTKKMHPADQHALEQIAKADRFAAVLFPGREHGYHTRYANTLAGAREEGRKLEAAFPHCGRRAIITAISTSGASFPVPSTFPA